MASIAEEPATPPVVVPGQSQNSCVIDRGESLADYLGRPVQIHTFLWSSTPLTTFKIDPWALLLNNVTIRKKLDHYAHLTATLNVKITVNGTPFHYGRLMVSYENYNGTLYTTEPMITGLQLVYRSQMATGYLDPTTSLSIGFELPFVHPLGKIELTKALGAQGGVLWFQELNVLEMANQAAPEPIRVTVLAWFTEPMAMTSTATTIATFTAQSGVTDLASLAASTQSGAAHDEYAVGPVSRIASTIANIAGNFVHLPVIGVYARATEIAASATSRLAALFGFSRPVDLRPSISIKNAAYTSLSTYSGIDGSKKLTFDPKQEITVDPSVLGFETNDPMTFSHISSKWSFVHSVNWPTTAAQGSVLLRFPVAPGAQNLNATTSVAGVDGIYYSPTPLSFVAQPFKYWTGSIEYHIQIVASSMHRGRLRLAYDSCGDSDYATSLSVAQSSIVDISETRDVCFTVAWSQTQQYASCFTMQFPGGTHIDGMTNGTVTVFVESELASLLASQGAYINFFVRAGPDFSVNQLATGTGLNSDVYYQGITNASYVAQSPATAGPANICPATSLPFGGNCKRLPNRDLVHFGENVNSFRQLIKVPRFYKYLRCETPSTSTSGKFTATLPVFPSMFGDPAPVQSYTFPGTAFAYVGPSFLAYLRPCYLGWRGSMRWKLMPLTKTSEFGQVRVLMADGTGVGSQDFLQMEFAVDYSADAASSAPATAATLCSYPTAVYYPTFGEPVEIEVPDYCPTLYRTTLDADSSYDDSRYAPASQAYVTWRMSTTATQPVGMNVYNSAGEDFGFFGFKACRPIYMYESPPVPSVLI
jgi:hypothetical protein